MTTTVNYEISGGGSGGGSGARYLGPMTWAALQSGAYADGSPGLAALPVDATVFVTDRTAAYVPNIGKTAWITWQTYGGVIGFSEAKSATGYTSSFSNTSQPMAQVTLAQNSGLLTQATVQLEAVGGAVYGIAYFPGPAKLINLPSGSLTLRCNVLSLVGTSSPGVLISVD